MNDPKLVIVKAITLLYREGLLSEKSENSADLVRTILETIILPTESVSLNHGHIELQALKETALYMCGNPFDTIYEKDEILQRLRVNCLNDDKLYEAFSQEIEKDMDEGSLKRTVLSIRKFINDTFRENEILKIIKAANSSICFHRDKIKSIRGFVNDLCTKLEPFAIESSRRDPAIVSSVDIGDTSGLSDAFAEVKAMADCSGLLITGWQGLNTMLQGGFRRGEQVCLPALQHKFKTGFTLTLFKQIAIYNKPVMINPNKKPLLLRISFEDSLSTNLQFLYQNLVFNETGVLPDIRELSTVEMAKYVKEKLQVNGYQIKLLRVDPSSWTYKDLQNYILELEANGYEIHLCVVDYLPMIPTTGCEDGPMGHALRDLYRRTRNFFSTRKITMITPHQLSTDAKQLLRDGHQNFVKLLPGRGYFSGSKQIDQEYDVGVYLHIEKLNKVSYLTLQRDKHRGVDVISEDDMYCVYEFPPKGPIPDDLGKPAIHMKKIGAPTVGSGHGDEVPFFMST